MKKILTTLSLVLALAIALPGCSIFRVHKMDIEQGNVMTPDMAKKLRLGMTQMQVEEIMGTPVLMNTFRDSRVDYVYTYKPGYEDCREKYITLTFWHGILKEVQGNLYSQVMNK